MAFRETETSFREFEMGKQFFAMASREMEMG